MFPFTTMPGSKKDKHYANTRSRRDSVIISHSGKKRKKDTDTESVSSSASTAVSDSTEKDEKAKEKKDEKDKEKEKVEVKKAQCPLRPYLNMMIEPEASATDGGPKTSKCPLTRVKLSHTLLLCLFISVNMSLVNGTLLVMGICRCVVAVWEWQQGLQAQVVLPASAAANCPMAKKQETATAPVADKTAVKEAVRAIEEAAAKAAAPEKPTT